MSLETARNLSIPDLLDVVNEKLDLECVKLREIRLPPIAWATSMEREIQSFEYRTYRVLRLIYSFRNLLRPVNRLPPEILTRVIRYVPDECDTDTWPIVVLTHVCRYWREIITSTPWNWTSISSRNDLLAEFSLKHAKGVPLEISFDMDQVRERPCFLVMINPHIRNARTIRISEIKTAEELTQGIPDFRQLTPNLQSLTLGRTTSYRDDWDDSGLDPFQSPVATTLRHLELIHFPLYPSFLGLRGLTKFTLFRNEFNLPLDALLDFLEENRSLESATLDINFKEYSLRRPRRGVMVAKKIQHLSIRLPANTEDATALASNIILPRGAHLEVICRPSPDPLKDTLSKILTAQSLSMRAPLFMEYRITFYKDIRLLGPSGGFAFQTYNPGRYFDEFPALPLTSVREFHYIHYDSKKEPGVFNPSFFPALEMFAITHAASASNVLSTLFSDPSFLPQLITLAFVQCDLRGDFMEELTRFACDRKDTTSARLRRVVIVDSRGNLPSVGSIEALEKQVTIVDVRVGKELPKDLT